MKRTFVIVTALMLSAAVYAQKTTFGIKAGVNSNSLVVRVENDGDKVNFSSSKIGFQAGGVADIAFSDKFSIQPNLLFVLKGGKYPNTQYAVNLFSVDVPINFLFKQNGFFAGAGPNISYGLSAKIKADGETIDLFDDNSEIPMKRFEVGSNILMGYQFASGLTLSANYTLGLTNSLNTDDPGETKLNNNFLGFSIGYSFGKK